MNAKTKLFQNHCRRLDANIADTLVQNRANADGEHSAFTW